MDVDGTAGVDQAHVADGVVEGDGVDTLAVVAVRAVAGARRARREGRVRPNLRVPDDLVAIVKVEGGRDVVLSRVGLGLLVAIPTWSALNRDA